MKKIAVIGAGISGLSSAFELIKAGHSVTLFADQFSPHTTSNRAAASWFPYHIRNDKRGVEWCSKSYLFYLDLSKNDDTGISMHRLVEMHDSNTGEADERWLDFMPPGSFRPHLPTELIAPFTSGNEATVPLIETQLFIPWLMNALKEQKVSFQKQNIHSFSALSEYDLIVNCSGLGSRTLCNDELVYPVRGQVALIAPQPGLPIFVDNGPPIYLVPRQDATILGGTMEVNEWDATTNEETLLLIRQRLSAIFPSIKNEAIIGSWAGLRPCRNELRLERKDNIIHNYGHGGSGYTLAWGCAATIAELASL